MEERWKARLRYLDLARRVAAYLVAIGCLWWAGAVTYRAVQGKLSLVGAVALSTGLLVLAVGLFRLNRYARVVVAAFFLVIAFFIPIAVFNPFAYLDGAAPPLASTLLWMIPLVVMLLIVAWLLNPPKVQTAES